MEYLYKTRPDLLLDLFEDLKVWRGGTHRLTFQGMQSLFKKTSQKLTQQMVDANVVFAWLLTLQKVDL